MPCEAVFGSTLIGLWLHTSIGKVLAEGLSKIRLAVIGIEDQRFCFGIKDDCPLDRNCPWWPFVGAEHSRFRHLNGSTSSIERSWWRVMLRRRNSASDEYLASFSAQRNHAATSRAGRSGRTRVAAASPRVEPIMVSQRRALSRRGECTPPAAKVTTKAKAKAPQAMS